MFPNIKDIRFIVICLDANNKLTITYRIIKNVVEMRLRAKKYRTIYMNALKWNNDAKIISRRYLINFLDFKYGIANKKIDIANIFLIGQSINK